MACETITASFMDNAEVSSSSDCMPLKQCEADSVDGDAEDAQSTQASEGVDNHHDDISDSEQVVERREIQASRTRRQLWADLVDSDDEEECSQGAAVSIWNEAECWQEKNEDSIVAELHEEGPEERPDVPAITRDTTLASKEEIKGSKRSKKKSSRSNGQKAPNNEHSSSKVGDVDSQWTSKNSTRRKNGSEAFSKRADNGSSKYASNTTSDRHTEKAYHKGQSMTGKRSRAQANEVSGPGGRSHQKLQCQFIIGIEEENKFRVVRRILGPGGQNMKRIADATGAKLRLRGRGSKFLEGTEQKESLDDLMLCISSQDEKGYQACVPMVQKILQRIYREYETFCKSAGRTAPRLQIHIHEGPREDSY
mmetsp:Transcript_152332/g.283805  ORF Transcript_152332/g.283805 Transcript_152332/m.283805 type:complete len:366 (+) Transcript_152332:83-1180(+)